MMAMSAGDTPLWIRRRTSRFKICPLAVAAWHQKRQGKQSRLRKSNLRAAAIDGPLNAGRFGRQLMAAGAAVARENLVTNIRIVEGERCVAVA